MVPKINCPATRKEFKVENPTDPQSQEKKLSGRRLFFVKTPAQD